MAQTYTLEEASERLGITPDEFKRRLRDDWKGVRSFRDGATLRFRAADIDELARTLGAASEPALVVPVQSPSPLNDSSEEVSFAPPPTPSPSKKGAGKSNPPKSNPPEVPLFLADDSDEDIFLPTTKGGSGTGLGKKKPDSDVRLGGASPSSKRKLTPGGSNPPSEEVSLDDLPPASGVGLGRAMPSSGGKLSGPKSTRIPGPASPPPPGDDASSEFELSLDPDSDSFELQLAPPGSSEEVSLGDEPPAKGGQSGINLGKPADSGVSLEKGKRKPADDDGSDVEFELALDPPAGGGSGRLSGVGQRKKVEEDSDSGFELTLDDGSDEHSPNAFDSGAGKGDIFETDFELPVVEDQDSGSEVLPVDAADSDLENSDFDLAIDDVDAPAGDESESQVVLVDEEEPLVEDAGDVEIDPDAPAPSARTRRGATVPADDDDVGAALSRRGATAEPEVRTVVAPPARWGVLPALFALPTFALVIFGALMGFESVRGLSSYQQPMKPSAPLVNGLSDTLGMTASK